MQTQNIFYIRDSILKTLTHSSSIVGFFFTRQRFKELRCLFPLIATMPQPGTLSPSERAGVRRFFVKNSVQSYPVCASLTFSLLSKLDAKYFVERHPSLQPQTINLNPLTPYGIF